MQRSDSIASLAAALCKAQGIMGVALKDKINPAFRSKYADLGAVWDAARDALQQHGLAVVQLPLTDEPGYAALETVILHNSGEFIASTSRARIVKDDPQGYGSAITFLRRYALSAALGIVADEDDDGHAASAPRAPQSRQQATSRPQSPATPAQPTAGKLSADAAKRLHAQLGAMLQETQYREMTHNAFAGQVIGREVGSLTDLTTAEAKEVYSAAQVAQQEAQAA
jgi:hypothetical protein